LSQNRTYLYSNEGNVITVKEKYKPFTKIASIKLVKEELDKNGDGAYIDNLYHVSLEFTANTKDDLTTVIDDFELNFKKEIDKSKNSFQTLLQHNGFTEETLIVKKDPNAIVRNTDIFTPASFAAIGVGLALIIGGAVVGALGGVGLVTEVIGGAVGGGVGLAGIIITGTGAVTYIVDSVAKDRRIDKINKDMPQDQQVSKIKEKFLHPFSIVNTKETFAKRSEYKSANEIDLGI
jgi:hypothetical protein